MGWNHLTLTQPNCPLFADLPPQPSVYFVHGYYAQPTDTRMVCATADYPEPFAAAIWRDNLFATQFHPEKSQAVGLRMLRNFARI
jgi:imidazole glycerol-phosphate synthase subunit HisH